MTVDRTRLEALVEAWDPAGPADLPGEVARALDDDPAFRAWFDARFAKPTLAVSSTPAGLARRVMPAPPTASRSRAWGFSAFALAAAVLCGVTGFLVDGGVSRRLHVDAPVVAEPPIGLADQPKGDEGTVVGEPVDLDDTAIAPPQPAVESVAVPVPRVEDAAPLKTVVPVDPAMTKVVQKNLGSIKSCYEAALELNANLSGRVDVTWVVADGRAQDPATTENTTGDSSLAACIVDKVKRWKGFPREVEGAVTWPFVFVAKSAPVAEPQADDNALIEGIKRTVWTEIPKLRRLCYEPLLSDTSSLEGAWLLAFTVQTDGAVIRISATPAAGTVPNALLQDCLERRIAEWPFQPIRMDLPVTKTIRFLPK